MFPAQQARARSAAHRTSRSREGTGSSAGFVIPFDHAASFELRGIPGNIVQDVINISTDGIFVAVSIGYGFEENRARHLVLASASNTGGTGTQFSAGDVRLDQIPQVGLIEGFRLNPRFEQFVFEPEDNALNAGRGSLARERRFSNRSLAPGFEEELVQHIKPADEISFLFSIVDTATGRELQDEPTHNLASLGTSTGERPFRLLAQPLTFQPRSTVRLQIIERSEGVTGTLFIVLYGYKILGSPPCPEPARDFIYGQGLSETPGPSDRVIPFDYVASFPFTGSPGRQLEEEIPINVEGGFVSTSIGYGLAVETLGVSLTNLPSVPKVDLRSISLKQFPTSALQEGVRIRPSFLRLAFGNNGILNDQLPVSLANRMFERLSRPDDVLFRYSIVDTGTGRELQNEPINNIAGLGIANGERPFKKFARPMLFLPRSTIRITVEERFGRGTLFIVFQGYKVLASRRSGEIPARTRRIRRR